MIAGPIFYEALDHVFRDEGGFVENKFDNGGATKYGITLKTLREHKNDPTLEVKVLEAMGQETAGEIYLKNYYEPLGLIPCRNRLACILIFNQAVNRGVAAVKDDLQSILGIKLNPSYPNIIDLLNFYNDESDKVPMMNIGFALDFLVRSQEHYIAIVKNNPKMSVFLFGWLARTHRLFYAIKVPDRP